MRLTEHRSGQHTTCVRVDHRMTVAVGEHGHRPRCVVSDAGQSKEGIDIARLSARFGIPSADLLDPERLAFHSSLGLVQQSGSRVAITEAGMPLLDALLGELVPDALVAA